MRAQVIDPVHHEIAHQFGISDARLRELARERDGTEAGR
jgi:predicted Zn-dependent protease with MMP-like domain